MKVRLNGAEEQTEAGTIGKLIEELGLPRQTVLVEHNREALARDGWDGATLREGDVIEVLRVAAGG